MNSVLLITLSGLDRPGLVQAIADVVAGLGANWEQSRMMHLSGRFVGLLEIHVEADKEDELSHRLRDLGDLELTIAKGEPLPSPAHSFELDVVGSDHPGIISEISGILTKYRINIEALTTWTESAPDSGTPLFRANALLSAKAAVNLAEFKEALEEITQDLMIRIDPVDG